GLTPGVKLRAAPAPSHLNCYTSCCQLLRVWNNLRVSFTALVMPQIRTARKCATLLDEQQAPVSTQHTKIHVGHVAERVDYHARHNAAHTFGESTIQH